jgi:heme/copper-type cytochrome/quinol oxidase subunit 3
MARGSSAPDLRVFGKEPPQRFQLLPNAVLGTIILIIAEGMLFAGMMSAFIIVKANATAGMWPPPGQPRLPIEMTAFNSVLLLLSGVAMWYAGKKYAEEPSTAARPLGVAMALGAFFVVLQGQEWVGLLGEGLTMTSSAYGAFFYLIVGTHALHAIGALIVLMYTYRWMRAGTLTSDGFWAMRLFWYFVVGLWPVLYWQVYL